MNDDDDSNNNNDSILIPSKYTSILEKLILEPQEPKLWKILGKTLLDDGEFAESQRVFCYGSKLCPDDTGLKHHVKVYETFHDSNSNTDATDDGDDDADSNNDADTTTGDDTACSGFTRQFKGMC